MSILEEIYELNYNVIETDNVIYGTRLHFLNLINPDGKELLIPFSDAAIAVGCAEAKTKEEAIASVQRGIGLITTGAKIYRAFYGGTDEEYAFRCVNYSQRAFEAIREEKKRLSFLKEKFEEDGPLLDCEPESMHTFVGAINSSEIQVGLLENGLWCAQFGIQADIDAFYTLYYFYAARPSEEDFWDTHRLLCIEKDLQSGKRKEEFTCRECGAKVFWLDCGDSIYQCAERADERYCGC